MSRIKIIVCCHKDDIKACSEVYMPLHVGKEISNLDLGITCDNIGDNISSRNSVFCELTGLYWAWKNLQNVDYIGFCHYRRYFDFHHLGRIGFPITTLPVQDFYNTDLTISQDVLKWLDDGYMILPAEWNLRCSVYLDYCEHHNSSDFRIMGDVIREMSPGRYEEAFLSSMVNSNHLIPLNMFIMSKEQLNNYCSWLFPILFETEKRINNANYNAVQKRIFGYMSERMLNIYIKAEHIRNKQLSILKFSDEKELFDVSLIQYKMRCLMNNMAQKLTKYYRHDTAPLMESVLECKL